MRDTNPSHYKVGDADFIKFMDDPQIKGFGDWMFANGFNAGEFFASNWINVKDELPTSIVNKVLVWLEHEDLNGYIGFGHYEKYKGQEIWYDLEHNEAFSIRGYAVTHWMPLPAPPKT